jgi:PAS domain S-box-containing protein
MPKSGKNKFTIQKDSSSLSHTLPVQKRFISFTPEDARTLKSLKRHLAPHTDRFVDLFYDHLLSFSQTRNLLTDLEIIARLKKSQAQYFVSLFKGIYDRKHVAERLRIGYTHEKIGLSPAWYLGTYSLYFQFLIPKLIQLYFKNPVKLRKALTALCKILLMDMQIAVEAYHSRAMEVINKTNEKLAQLVVQRTEQLKEMEIGYSDLVENSPEMIFSVNQHRQILTMNRTGLEKLGYRLEELREEKLENLAPPSYKFRTIEHVRQVTQEGYSELETVFVGKNKEELEVEISSSAMYTAAGEFQIARSFARDVTDRKKLEKQLQRWERLAAVGSMSAKVAHEIKNPLSALSLNLELLEDEVDSYQNVDSKEAKTLFASISSELERLTTLTDEYLQFARLPKQTPELINLSELVPRLIPLMGAELHRRGIRLSLQIPEGLPLLEGEKNQLLQVFINLLRNAEEAMPNGGSVTIAAKQEDSFLQVRVRDTGTGIDPEDLPNIFDPFYTTKDTGTGLGLSFVEQVMREMQGKVTCESEKGKGSTFILYFPIKAGAADD